MELIKEETTPELTLQKQEISFDPRKRYRWAKETEFVLSGGEYGVILNSLRETLSTKEAQAILLAERASAILEKALENAVKSGHAQEDTGNSPN